MKLRIPGLPRIGRRTALKGAAGAVAAMAIGPTTHLLASDENDGRRFVSLYFNGGWDVLVGLDARDPSRTYSALHTGVDQLMARDNARAFADPIEVRIGEHAALWGAALQPIADRHADVTTLFRSVNMNTVAHPTGRAYVNSFQPPAGVVVRGDSISTRMAAGSRGDQIMPNVSLLMPTFNDSYAPDVTGIRVNRATEVKDLLRPLEAGLGDDLETLLRQAQDATSSCVVSERYPGRAPADDLRASRSRVRDLLSRGLDQQFDFSGETNATLRSRFGIANPANGREPGVIAATASQLFKSGLTRAISAQVQAGLDTHNTNWAASQPQRQAQAWRAVAALLDDLREDDPSFERTTVICHSEFARTPRINGNRGRDHWFANSMVVFGGGLRRGVCGATALESLGLQETELATGLPMEGGHMLMPEDIGATLAAAAGVDSTPFRVSPLTDWIGA